MAATIVEALGGRTRVGGGRRQGRILLGLNVGPVRNGEKDAKVHKCKKKYKSRSNTGKSDGKRLAQSCSTFSES